MKYEKGTFTVVPNRQHLRGLPAATQAVYFWLCSYADEYGQCYPSRSTLAKDIGGGVRTIDTHLQKLEVIGLIEKQNRVKGNEKQTNLYQLLVVEGSANIAPPSADIALPSAVVAQPSADIAHRTITTQLQTIQLKNTYGELANVHLSNEEHTKLGELLGLEQRDDLIEQLSLYIPNKPGKKYTDHYATIRSWARKKKDNAVRGRKTVSFIG